MIGAPPTRARSDEACFVAYVAHLQAALREQYEADALRDWQRYAAGIRASSEPYVAGRPRLAKLFQDSDVLDLVEHWRPLVGPDQAAMLRRLQLRGVRIAVDFDERTLALADLADDGDEQATTELFGQRELLARRAGYGGYAELALASDGITRATVQSALEYVESTTREPFRQLLEDVDCTGMSSRDVGRAIRKHRSAICAEHRVPDGADAWAALRTAFDPLLDDVELALGPDVGVAGFCKVVCRPDDVRVAIRTRTTGDAAPAERLDALAVVGHECGHALHYHLLRELGAEFEELAATSAAVEETFAEIAERLLFEPEIAERVGFGSSQLPPLRRCWELGRLWFLRQQVGRVRFELDAYAAAFDDPESLPALWRQYMEAATRVAFADVSWESDGHGFYTEDPMRRYAYLVAYAWADGFFAAMPPLLTLTNVVAELRLAATDLSVFDRRSGRLRP